MPGFTDSIRLSEVGSITFPWLICVNTALCLMNGYGADYACATGNSGNGLKPNMITLLDSALPPEWHGSKPIPGRATGTLPIANPLCY